MLFILVVCFVNSQTPSCRVNLYTFNFTDDCVIYNSPQTDDPYDYAGYLQLPYRSHAWFRIPYSPFYFNTLQMSKPENNNQHPTSTFVVYDYTTTKPMNNHENRPDEPDVVLPAPLMGVDFVNEWAMDVHVEVHYMTNANGWIFQEYDYDYSSALGKVAIIDIYPESPNLNNYTAFNIKSITVILTNKMPDRPMLLHFQKYDNDIMLNHKINGNFHISVASDKNFEHANFSVSVDEHVTLLNESQLMCKTASGHRRLAWGQNEELHSCKCPIVDDGSYLYPDCEEWIEELTLEVKSGHVLGRSITANGLTFANCGFKCDGVLTVPTGIILTLNDLLLESDGMLIVVEGTVVVNIHIPAPFPAIAFDVRNGGMLRITSVSFDDPDSAKNNAVFSTNTDITIQNIKKSECFDTHQLNTYVTTDSTYVCMCHFSDNNNGDVFKEDGCDEKSSDYVLVLPDVRTITASRKWNAVMMIEDVDLNASDSSVVYTVGTFDASYGGMIDMAFTVNTLVVQRESTIIRVRTLHVNAIETDINEDVLVVAEELTYPPTKHITKSCQGGVGGMSRWVVGSIDVGCECTSHEQSDENGFDQRDCSVNVVSQWLTFVVDGQMTITGDRIFKTLRHTPGSLLVVQGSLVVQTVTLEESITFKGVVTIISMNLPDTYLYLPPLMILNDTTQTPHITNISSPTGCVDLLSSVDAIEDVSTIPVPDGYVLQKLVDGKLYRLCPSTVASDYVQCNIVTEVFNETFISPYCPCDGCTFFIDSSSFDFGDSVVVNPVLIALEEGTSLTNFASIDMLTIANGVSNARVVGTNAPLIETLVVETGLPVHLESVYVNNITFIKSSTVVTDDLLAIEQAVINTVEGAAPVITFTGDGEAAITEVIGENVVIDSNIRLLTLSYATTPVNITARKSVRITYDATLSAVRVPVGGELIITKDVRVLDIMRIELLITPITVDKSTAALSISLGEAFDETITTPTEVLDATVRKITGTPTMCDGQVLLAGVGSMDEAAVCTSFGMSEHVCTFDNSVEDWVVNEHIDYSCPCTTSVIPCRTHVNNARVNVMDFTTDTLVLGPKVTELTGVNGKAMELRVVQVLDQLSIVASDSFLSINDADLLLSLELTGTLYIVSNDGVNVISKRLTKDNDSMKMTKNLAMHTVRIGNDASTCNAIRIVENDDPECVQCRGNTIRFGSSCLNPQNSHCAVRSTDVCVRCQDGYYMDDACVPCPSKCRDCNGQSGVCVACADGYTLSSGKCVAATASPCDFYHNEVCHSCGSGAFFQPPTEPGDAFCFNCTDAHCLTCHAGTCTVCDVQHGFILDTTSGACVKPTNATAIANGNTVACATGMMVDGVCVECSSIVPKCTSSSASFCTECAIGFVVGANGECVAESDCLRVTDGRCERCLDGHFFDETRCAQCNDHCIECSSLENCHHCETGFVRHGGECLAVGDAIPHCTDRSDDGCLRCEDGFVLTEDATCKPCDAMCATCFGSTTQCTTCHARSMLVINETTNTTTCNDVGESCRVVLESSGGGCAICESGYFRSDRSCLACHDNCTSCAEDETKCLTCKEGFYMSAHYGRCIKTSDAVHCLQMTKNGCMQCDEGTFLSDGECFPCVDGCTTCVLSDVCQVCNTNRILRDGVCVGYEEVQNCLEVSNSKCSKCGRLLMYPNKDGTSCVSRMFIMYIVVAAIVVIVVITALIAFVWAITGKVNKNRMRHLNDESSIYPMKYSNASFFPTSVDGVVIDTDEISAPGEIDPGNVFVGLVNVGNVGRDQVMVQIALKETTTKCTVTVQPPGVLLARGKACEFRVGVTPTCSCSINDVIGVVVTNMRTGKTKQTHVTIKLRTVRSTIIHFSDVVESSFLGEGSFGIVYKGVFEGNEVAVKEMKEVGASEESLDDFLKEVGMLDKFRCDFIVHFYGACLIPNHLMIVTEFAPCGSLMDCIKKKDEPSEQIKVKIMLDASKGLEYLHNNGILHRDIKPDNVLVFSLSDVIEVNGKLTDFGSSRNINMLMTNMTFTKGIGTPVYMAPDIFEKEKYKKAADVYSFGVMMYECFKWGEAFPKETFKYPWDIVSFIGKNERPPKPSHVSDELFEIVEKSWKTNACDRISCENATDSQQLRMLRNC